jgi:hypothetical protein
MLLLNLFRCVTFDEWQHKAMKVFQSEDDVTNLWQREQQIVNWMTHMGK